MISLLIAAFATVDMTKFEDAVWFVETSRREGMIWGDEGRSLGSSSGVKSVPPRRAGIRPQHRWQVRGLPAPGVLNQDSASVSGSLLHGGKAG